MESGNSRRRTASNTETRIPELDHYAQPQPQLSRMVWEAGSQQVKDTLSSYGRIDIFRPYFDVEPRHVRNRLIQSLIPRKPSQMNISNDMYGPTMIALTQVALLLYAMKASGYTVKDGTLIGTALVTCFSAWIAITSSIYALCFTLNVDVAFINFFSLLGYSLFGHCIVIILNTLFHSFNSHWLFYLTMAVFSVPSALRVCLFLCSRTFVKTHKLIITAVTCILHLGYLCYLHFGFHVMIQEINEIFADDSSGVSVLPVSDTSHGLR